MQLLNTVVALGLGSTAHGLLVHRRSVVHPPYRCAPPWRLAAPGRAAATATSDSSDSADAILDVCIDAGRAASGLIVEKLGAEVIKSKANARDLLTAIDIEVQDLDIASYSFTVNF